MKHALMCLSLITLLLASGLVGGFQRTPTPQPLWKATGVGKIWNYHVALQGRMENNSEDQDSSNSRGPETMSDSFPSLITANKSRSLAFSGIMAICGAALGPFLDSCKSLLNY